MPPRRRGMKRSTLPVRKRAAGLQRARLGVCERADGACEAGVVEAGCLGVGTQAHHRKRRSQGGSNGRSNLLWVCANCHGWIHANPAAAYVRKAALVPGLTLLVRSSTT